MFFRKSRKVLLSGLLCLLGGATAAQAENRQTMKMEEWIREYDTALQEMLTMLPEGTQSPRVAVVYDGSRSMLSSFSSYYGVPKFELASHGLRSVLPHLMQDTDVDLWRFGGENQGSCMPVHAYSTVQGEVKLPSMHELKDWQATPESDSSRGSPLWQSILAANDMMLEKEGHPRSVLLISDGSDQCEPSPLSLCEEITPLGEAGLTVHVLSVNAPATDHGFLSCLAKNTGGTFVHAPTPAAFGLLLDVLSRLAKAEARIAGLEDHTHLHVDLRKKIKKLKEMMKQMHDQLVELTVENTRLKAEIAASDDIISGLKGEVSHLEDAIVEHLESASLRATQLKNQCTAQITEIEQQLATCKAERERDSVIFHGALEEKDLIINDLKAENADLRVALTEVAEERDHYRDLYEAEVAKHDALVSALARLERENLGLRVEVDDWRAKFEEALVALQECEEAFIVIDKLPGKLEQCRAENEVLNQTIIDLKMRNQELEHEIVALLAALDEAEMGNKALQASLYQAHKTIEDQREIIEVLKHEIHDKDLEIVRLQGIIQKLKKCRHGHLHPDRPAKVDPYRSYMEGEIEERKIPGGSGGHQPGGSGGHQPGGSCMAGDEADDLSELKLPVAPRAGDHLQIILPGDGSSAIERTGLSTGLGPDRGTDLDVGEGALDEALALSDDADGELTL